MMWWWNKSKQPTVKQQIHEQVVVDALAKYEVMREQNEQASHLVEAASGDVDGLEEQGFRPITSDADRNLSPLTQARMRKIAAKLWEANNLANRIIEIPVAYLLAEGITITHEDNAMQEIIDQFLADPIVDFEQKLTKRVRELGLFGEQFLPAFVNEYNGRVRIAYLDPEQVREIVYDPDNSEQPIGVITERDKKGRYRKYKVIVNADEQDCFTSNTIAIRETFADGELFYFAINTLGSKARGRSDLLAQADYLDIYDNFLFGEAERVDFLRAFVWHWKIEGATEDEIKNIWQKKFGTPPRSGSCVVSNEKVTGEAKSPTLGSEDTEKSARLMRNHVLGGATIPEHVFGGGGDVNRSTGDSMMEPFEKLLTMRQSTVKQMVKSIIVYVLRQKEMANSNKQPDLDHSLYSVNVTMPEMTAKDTTKYATALQQVVTACQQALNQKLLTEETALQIIAAVAGRMGVDIDPKDELEKAKQKASKTKEEDVFTEDQEQS